MEERLEAHTPCVRAAAHSSQSVWPMQASQARNTQPRAPSQALPHSALPQPGRHRAPPVDPFKRRGKSGSAPGAFSLPESERLLLDPLLLQLCQVPLFMRDETKKAFAEEEQAAGPELGENMRAGREGGREGDRERGKKGRKREREGGREGR